MAIYILLIDCGFFFIWRLMSRKLSSFSFVFQTVASEMLPHSPNVAASLEIVWGTNQTGDFGKAFGHMKQKSTQKWKMPKIWESWHDF